MRRAKVHKVIQMDTAIAYYATRCGITGGAELLKLSGWNNGSGSFCAGCWREATIRRNAGYRAREAQQWR